MEILLDNRQRRIEIDPEGLKKTAQQLLEGLGCSPAAMLSLSLVASGEMAELNLKFRGKQGPTNVLSFSQKEGDEQSPTSDLLGDVVICTDRAADDAADLGYTDVEMVVYLLIHGVLHLMGVHHDRPEEAEEMRARVDTLFNEMFPIKE